ncbi:Peroxisome biogenesis protein 3-2 [Acorus gramineus]|uniref:Peroxisome biogenesis protein 3-2 n=1 Tax=Acorus gramineus TaxID=55184 RepID=A0AAV9BVY1_ACOGR|nr:Peroxisome biogenesis protein 3-2 [Acorus gramineus]
MFSLRGFWRRHRRKIIVTAGVLGSGYAIYTLYEAYKQRVSDLVTELESEREIAELFRTRLQNHFENIQSISDTMTLPHVIHEFRLRVSDEVDLSYHMNRLMQGKGQPGVLSVKEKRELWEELKILSFTRMVTSLWGMTLLCLYVRVLVNILGRHLYIEASKDVGSSLDEETVDNLSQKVFLATADHLATHGMKDLISNMQIAATGVLKQKQLWDPFSIDELHETIMQIMESVNTGSSKQWLTCLLPENALAYSLSSTTSSNDIDGSHTQMNIEKLQRLIAETRDVLASADFGNVMEMSLKKVVDGLMEDFNSQGTSNPSPQIPLAKLIPRVVQLGPTLLDEPSNNRFVQIILSLPEVQLFFTLLYTNITQDT